MITSVGLDAGALELEVAAHAAAVVGDALAVRERGLGGGASGTARPAT